MLLSSFLLPFPPGTTLFPGGNDLRLSTCLLFTFPPGTICIRNSTLEGVECHLLHVRSASLLFLLLPLLLRLRLLLLLLFRGAARHLMQGLPVPCINALQSAATWLAGLGPRRTPVGSVAGLLMRS